MTNNEIFKRFLQLTGAGLNDKEQLIEIFRLGDIHATHSKIRGWRTPMSSDRASAMPDKVLSGFLDGLFKYRDQLAEKGITVFNFDDVN